MQRLFFSLKFTSEQQQQLLQYQTQALALSNTARAVAADNLHLTLFFLGQVDELSKQQLLAAAEQICAVRFRLTLDYLACFSKPKILYLAPSHIPSELSALQQQLAKVCKAQGFDDMHDHYRPHITLARHGLYDGTVAVTPLSLDLSEFALYVSENQHGKVQYRPLHRMQLI
jgi:RNA 2',3'-cyclic 3'-phosphodiesterase